MALLAVPTWTTPPVTPVLGPTDVHVWRMPLALPAAMVAQLATTLAPDEQDRAARFRFERDQIAFTCVRGALRTLAGRYLYHAPERLEIGYRANGKPHLITPVAAPLRFNVSHSGDSALLAFTRDRELGVDLELRKPIEDLLSLAAMSFSPREYAVFRELPRDVQPIAFFACWSRKEAFIKATGEGIAQLAAFDVSMRPDEPARILWVASPAEHARWTMHELPEIPGYAAALVVERTGHGRHDPAVARDRADETTGIEVACWVYPGDAERVS